MPSTGHRVIMALSVSTTSCRLATVSGDSSRGVSRSAMGPAPSRSASWAMSSRPFFASSESGCGLVSRSMRELTRSRVLAIEGECDVPAHREPAQDHLRDV